MSGAKLRVGVVGSGFGGTVHVPAFQHHPRFEVVAIASPRNAARVAAERGIANAYVSIEAMLAGEALDVVSIASPPFTHHDAVLAALAHGAHVLCEKPFALSVAQAEAMAAAGAASGKACTVAHEFRYLPIRRAVFELIRNGHLGALRNIEVATLTGRARRDVPAPRSWWFDRARGGGIAGAIMSHQIDLVNWLMAREPLRAIGVLRTAIPERIDEKGPFSSTADDGAFAVLDYGEGAIARLCADGTTCVTSATLAVHGDARTVVGAGQDSVFETNLFAIDADETAELEIKASKYAKLAAASQNLPPFLDLLDAFVDRIEGRGGDAPTFADAVGTQRVLESVGYK